MNAWNHFLLLSLTCIVVQSFFAMLEMAVVSFNKVRLQYYISQGSRRAIWIQYLLSHPALLFGTTLIAINASLLIGSECSRRFYESVGLSPTWAPLTQAFLILIFAEIAPMFAGRRYSEHAAMIGIGILYMTAWVLKPVIFCLDQICLFVGRLFGMNVSEEVYLSQEEIQHIVEARQQGVSSQEEGEFDTVVSNIFSLKHKTAKELMLQIQDVVMMESSATVKQVREIVGQRYVPYIPLFHKRQDNVVSIVYPRDLLRLSDDKKVKDHTRSPWFITENMSILQILKQFRKNNQSLAIVLSESGKSVGILTFDEIVDEIFEVRDFWNSFSDIYPAIHQISLDRAFPGDMSLLEFSNTYQMQLRYKQAKTLAQVMELALGHVPREGESVRIDQFELKVEEAHFMGPKTISVRTIS